MAAVALALAGALALWALRAGDLAARPSLAVAASLMGLAAVAGFAVTGIAGADDFEPVALKSASFVMPAGNALVYLMTFTGASANFGIAVIGGTLAGSFLASLARRNWSV